MDHNSTNQMSSTRHTEALLGFLRTVELNAATLSKAERVALDEDIKFAETALTTLRAGEGQSVEELWQRIQFLSRFFGGDYLPEDPRTPWIHLTENFKREVLDRVTEKRQQVNLTSQPKHGEDQRAKD